MRGKAKTWLKWALAGAAILAVPGPALGWSEQTHQTTAAIAWLDLSARANGDLAELLAIARQHPDYPRFAPFAAGLSPRMQDRALLEWLARWPDDIRGSIDDQPKWHYQLEVVSGRTWLWPIYNGDASGGFAFNYARLANPCASTAQRAKAIGWLIHIVGDIQQPLHAGHQMTAQYALTDRAGELAFVRRTAGGEPTNLHYYWDQMIEQGGATMPAGQDDWARYLSTLWPRERLPELQRQAPVQDLFASYRDESAVLARLIAYQGSYLAAAPASAQAPVVTARENATALSVVRRRVATAGYRIADMLASALADARARRHFCPTAS